ncbi:LAME_0D07272g1_1 [Lachancea meyersii CBS 8951]|uniref:LAME_0D07272g1_1 n=1 Tax=Lachancea meyersii CBS 8951 TaxID=1266667 RepID=A0A1G4J9L4_9SACH|nr:LAME_0D07272g1_1 [Lachancea meyersii CBS 8951]
MASQKDLNKRPFHSTSAVTCQRKKFRPPHADPMRFNKKLILPVFEPSGLLALETHSKEGIQLEHTEPHDSISPSSFYQKFSIPLRKQTHFQAVVYSDSDENYLAKYDLLDQTNYLVGRKLSTENESPEQDEDREVVLADIPIPEETCSKQHCVIQFRNRDNELKAYVIDLNSSNGTLLNDVALPRARYVELRNEDVLRFSTHESDSDYFLAFTLA